MFHELSYLCEDDIYTLCIFVYLSSDLDMQLCDCMMIVFGGHLHTYCNPRIYHLLCLLSAIRALESINIYSLTLFLYYSSAKSNIYKMEVLYNAEILASFARINRFYSAYVPQFFSYILIFLKDINTYTLCLEILFIRYLIMPNIIS